MVEYTSTESIQKHFDDEGRYLIVDTLGRGNFGIVYRVLDKQWQQEVALKTTLDGTPEQKQWLKEEYRIQSDIAHPILVPPDELRREGERYFFTMKLIEGATPFNEYFDFDRQGSDAAQKNSILRICRAALELADGLRTIHGYDRCHGDIKPDNVLVGKNGQIALLDFGLMRSTSEADGAHSPTLIGTPAYLAPEQYDGTAADVSSDWYALALMLHETLVGKPAFSGDPLEVLIAKQMSAPSIAEQMPIIPADLAALIDGMLDPLIDNRPSIAEVFSVLEMQANRGNTADTLGSSVWRSSDRFSDESFVAREHELSILQEKFESSRRGEFSLVEIVGPSGIGKTSLIQRFLGSIRAEYQPLILHGRCQPHESIPYKAFDAIVDRLTNHWINLDQLNRQQLIPAQNADAMVILFPELMRIDELGVLANRTNRHADPHAMRLAGFKALSEVFSKLAHKQPLVLWIDDIQWADKDSAALLEGIFARSKAPPAQLIITRRPDIEVAEAALTNAIENIGTARRLKLTLDPLTKDSCHELVRSIFGADKNIESKVSAKVIDQIIEQAGGLPYLVSELAHFVKRENDVSGIGSDNKLDASLLSARLKTLEPENAVLLELAAVAASPLTPNAIMAAAESGQRFRLRDLTILRLLRWVSYSDRKSIEIYHDHLREYVVSGLSKENLLKRHAALLAAMEAAGHYESESLLTHAQACGNHSRTRFHALQAAERASDSLAFEQAAAFYKTALETYGESDADVAVQISYADALANAGRSLDAAPAYEAALTVCNQQDHGSVEFQNALRRRAGEQYLKCGHFNDGLRIMSEFLKQMHVSLPTNGLHALMVIATRRAKLYFGGIKPSPAVQPPTPAMNTRLDDLWAATTALSMMDPVRADCVGLLHFLESIAAGDASHLARSYGYEAAFAALIGGSWFRTKANELLAINAALLDEESAPYERAFYHLGLGAAAFLSSDWSTAVTNCDLAAHKFRGECRGAEYEAAVSTIWSLQALGQAGEVKELLRRLPKVIQRADERGDLFAANSYRGGFHALGRIAAGQLDVVQNDLEKIVETWMPGLYQMHAYHRIFAGVNADLYQGNPHAAMARIEDDWGDLRRGLYLTMELPAVELRWTRAKALLSVAAISTEKKRNLLMRRVTKLCKQIERANIPAAIPHGALLRAGVHAIKGEKMEVIGCLRTSLSGYTNANMQIHREVTRWALAQLVHGDEGNLLAQQCQLWQEQSGVEQMLPLVGVIAPAVSVVFPRKVAV